MTNKFLLLFFIIALVTGCQTHRSIIPTINASPRSGIVLKKPINISIKDGRATPDNSVKTVDTLIAGLVSTYQTAIKIVPYFSAAEDSSIEIKINIMEVGAQFGARYITYTTVHNELLVASSAVSTKWGTAVSTAIISQPIYDETIVTEGWWVGTSYLQITFVDNSTNTNTIYNFPIVAEDTQSNTLGYKSAKIATTNSWNKASSSLLNFIDAVIYSNVLKN
jgi:hypothetical protein